MKALLILVLIMKLVFNTHGNDKQKEVCRLWLDPAVFDIAYGGSKGSGKSYLGVSLIFGDAFLYPGTHYFIARKKLNDLRKHTIPSIHEVFKHWGIKDGHYSFNGQDNLFRLYNGSVVYLLEAKYAPSDPLYYRFGSMQMTRGWIEEAGEFEIAAKNNLAASIGRWKNDEYKLPGKLLQTCNPSKNYLYYDYYQAFKKGTIEPWRKFVQALPEDNKKLPDGYLEHLRRTLSTNEKERLLYGNWEYDDDPAALLNYDNITSIFSNDFVPSGKKYITADIARFGKDKSIIRIWDGLRVVERIELEKKKLTVTAQVIKAKARQYGIPMHRVIADEDGVGGGVVDQLGCVGFVANSSPILGANFDNLKSQCGFKLAELIMSDQIYEPVKDESVKEKLIQELEQLKQKSLDTDGKRGLIPKDKIKDLIGRSPDDLDTYIMRMYFELKDTKARIKVSIA